MAMAVARCSTRDRKRCTQRTRGATADYMAALAMQLSCGDDCQVTGPAGSFATALGAPSRDPGAFGCWGLARPMSQAR